MTEQGLGGTLVNAGSHSERLERFPERVEMHHASRTVAPLDAAGPIASLDMRASQNILALSRTGNFRSALGLWFHRGPFAFSGQNLESPAFHFSRRAAAHLRQHDIVSAVGLAGTEMLQSDRPGHEVGDLQAD